MICEDIIILFCGKEYSTLPVICVSPENPTQSIGNVLEDRDVGEEMVVVDKGETEGFAVV